MLARLDPLTVVLAAVGVVLAWHVSSGPHLFDAGELVAASWELGGSHPPGQPLHALASHVLARVPLGSVALRVALFSAVCALIAAALAARIARELCACLGVAASYATWAGVAAALATVLSSPVLRQALRPEVYALALALTLASVHTSLRWARGATSGPLYLGAFLAGLAAAVHPPHGLAAALVGLALGLGRTSRWLRRPAVLALAALCALAGLTAYVYLPLRAQAGAGVWGDPTTATGLWRYVTARAYAQNLGTSNDSSLGRLLAYGLYLMQHGGFLAVAGIGLCLSLVPSSRRTPFTGLALGAAACVLVPCVQPFKASNPDNVAYLGPAVALLIAAGAAGFACVTATRSRAVGAFGLVALAISPQSLPGLPRALASDLPALDTLTASLLETPPPRALVVATTDHAAASLWMARTVDAARPDVALFVAGLATSSWHWRSLATHPALDGKPVRGPGRDAHAQYLAGAVTSALPHVPVALEQDLSPARPPAVAGAYVLLPPAGAAPPDPPLRAQSLGERLHPVIVDEARRGPEGDHGAARAIVRDYELRRGRRVLSLGLDRLAIAAFGSAMYPTTAAERALLAAPDAVPPRPLPPVVQDPASFMTSRGEAARAAATALWALHRGEAATRLLELQSERGDARAILQLGWLQLHDGNLTAARTTLEAFAQHAPRLAPEGAQLAAAIESIAASE